MTDRHHPDDLAQLRAEFAAFRARVEAERQPRRRSPRRFLPLTLVGLLVAVLPLSILAAGPVFSDLGAAAPVHQPNIQAIGDAGITTGFADPADPTKRVYDPKGLVTREEMASFLARTAGLGGNLPVVNAKTAQDAAAFGGQEPSAYLSSVGDVTLHYPFHDVIVAEASEADTVVHHYTDPVTNVATTATGEKYLLLSLERPASMFGRALAVKSVRICARTYTAGAHITGSRLQGFNATTPGFTTIVNDTTAHPAGTGVSPIACYDIVPATPLAMEGPLVLSLTMDFTATTGSINFYSASLTLTPVAAGAAEAPGNMSLLDPAAQP